MTAQGQPRTIFRRAVERGNLIVAEGMAREMGQVTLAESLALTALAAVKGDRKRSRYALRWVRRLLDEDQNLTIDEGVLAASAFGVARRPLARARIRDPRGDGRTRV